MKESKATFITLRQLLKGLPLILGFGILGVIIVTRYLRYATPQYESTAKIKLADMKDGIPNSNLYKDFDVFVSNTKIGAEVELIRSEAILSKAVSNLNVGTKIFRVGEILKTELYNQSPIRVMAALGDEQWKDQPFTLRISDKSKLRLITPDGEELAGTLNTPIATKKGSVLVTLNDSLLRAKPHVPVDDHYEFIVYSQAGLFREIGSNLDVMSVDKDVPVLRITYKSPIPQKSADLANGIANAYINDYIDEKCKSADTTSNFLKNQLTEYSSRLSASENGIEQYRDAHNIVNITQETETDLRKIADLKKQLASVSMNLRATDSLNRYIHSGKDRFLELAPNFEAFTDLLSTEMVKNIKQLQAEKRDLLTRYTAENERVQVIDNKIGDLTSYLAESIQNTETNLRIKYSELNRAIQEAESSFSGLPEREKNMTILARNFGLNEQIYRFLQEKRTDAEIAKAATLSFHRIISRGEVPRTPVSPNVKLLKVFSGLLGLLAGTLILLGGHYIRKKIGNAAAVQRQSDTPVSAVVPYLTAPGAKHAFFRKWLLQMELKQWLPSGAILTVSSIESGEGKRFTAEGLARAAAETGKRVLLIGIDGRGPSLDIPCAFLPAQELPAKWQQPAVWNAAISAWKEEYELVIIRNAAVSEDPAAMTVMTGADVNLMLLDTVSSCQNCIREADGLKEDLSLCNMTFVLNRDGFKESRLAPVRRMIRQTFGRNKQEPAYA